MGIYCSDQWKARHLHNLMPLRMMLQREQSKTVKTETLRSYRLANRQFSQSGRQMGLHSFMFVSCCWSLKLWKTVSVCQPYSVDDMVKNELSVIIPQFVWVENTPTQHLRTLTLRKCPDFQFLLLLDGLDYLAVSWTGLRWNNREK